FSFSFLIGYLPGMIAKWKEGKGFLVRFFVTKHELSWVFILVLVLVGLNWNYFSPQGGKMGSLTDDQKFSGFAWDLQQTAGIYDYLPSTAVMAPRAPMSGLAEVLEGDATVTNQSAG